MKDGGPAFPSENLTSIGAYEVHGLHRPGMSLRDWFAGQAMNGVLRKSRVGSPDPKDTARWAYYVADAMLIERQKEMSDES